MEKYNRSQDLEHLKWKWHSQQMLRSFENAQQNVSKYRNEGELLPNQLAKSRYSIISNAEWHLKVKKAANNRADCKEQESDE